MRQVFDFSFNIGGVTLPKYALYDKQIKAHGLPARAMWVDDPRDALKNRFKVTFYVTSTREKHVEYLDVTTSAIARRFHNFAMGLPADNLRRPMRVITNKDIQKTGPRDKTVPPVTGGRPQKWSHDETTVVNGCKLGPVKVRVEGYNYLRLGLSVEL